MNIQKKLDHLIENATLPAENLIANEIAHERLNISLTIGSKEEISRDEEHEGNVITAQFLNLAMNVASEISKEKFNLTGAFVKGPLKLSTWKTELNIWFGYCNFQGGIIIDGCSLRELIFISCITRQLHIAKSTIAGNFAFMGVLTLGRGLCPGSLFCTDTIFKSNVVVTHSSFNAQMIEDQDQYEQTVSGDNAVGFLRCNVIGNFSFEDITTFGRLQIYATQFNSYFRIADCALTNPLRKIVLETNFSEFSQGVLIKDSFFWGGLSFDSTRVTSQLELNKVVIANSVQFDESKIEHEINYPVGLRTDQCAVSAKNAKTGMLEIRESIIAGYLNFRNMSVDTDFVLASTTLSSDNNVALEEGSRILFSKMDKEPQAIDTVTEVQSGLYFMLCSVGGLMTLQNIKTDDEFHVNLDFATVRIMNDDETAWPKPGFLSSNGLKVTEFAGDIPLERRSEWVLLQQVDRFSVQPYQLVARLLRERGLNNEADELSMEWIKLRATKSPIPRLQKMGYYISRYTIGNGYRPFRSLLWAFGIILVSTLVFWVGQPFIISKSDIILVKDFSPVMFAIDSFIPIIQFGHEDNYIILISETDIITSLMIRAYYWLHVAAGWIITTISVVGFSGIIRKG